MSPSRRIARVGVGAGLLAGSWLALRGGPPSASEERVFRAINHLPDSIRTPVRAVMQAGTFATVPIASGMAVLAGRRALAARLLLGGTVAWLGAKAIKPLGGRDRPAGLLDDVRIREGIEGDLGWVSGHTAVATSLALIASDDVPTWVHPLLVGVVSTTAFGRIYVGAHLPHDVVGGAGLGSVIAGLLG